MSAHELSLADGGVSEVDICEVCGGVFLDFFDGEPGEISRRLAAGMPGLETSSTSLAGTPSCPDCRLPMKPVRYLEHGPAVARCAACAGLFATRQQLAALAEFAQDEDEEAAPPSLLARVMALFRPRDA